VKLELEVISRQPRAFIINNFISDAEADAIVKKARPLVTGSHVGDPDIGVQDSGTRTSKNTWLHRHAMPVTATVYTRAADLLGVDEKLLNAKKCAEDMQVVHYTHGEKYDAHHDWGVAGYPESRLITLLLYLTDMPSDTAGGETSFPKGNDGHGMKVRPKKGMAMLFYNLLEDGNGDDLSMHASLPTVQGEKWLANFWVWDPKFHAD
jgi:prolyl 4-hydroxylase